jgi:hypothetical protein
MSIKKWVFSRRNEARVALASDLRKASWVAGAAAAAAGAISGTWEGYVLAFGAWVAVQAGAFFIHATAGFDKKEEDV